MENTALQVISGAEVAQIGETRGKLEELAGMVRDLLGENFRPTTPATEHDAAVILDWLRSGKKADTPNTLREYLRDITGPTTGFLTYVNGKPLARVTRQDVQGFKGAIAETEIPATDRRPAHRLAASTQRRMLAAVKGLLSHASGIGYLRFNAGKGVSLPALPESKRDKALSRTDSMRALITAQNRATGTETEKRQTTRRRDYLLNRFCYLTGGRISEVLNLTWKDIYATDNGAEVRILGKGRKERVLRISVDMFEALEAERAGAAEEVYVFMSQKGGRLSISQGWRIVKATAAAAGIQRKMTPHTWRHTVATQLLDGGAPLHQVSEFLGHSDPRVTVKSYYSESAGLKVEDFIDV